MTQSHPENDTSGYWQIGKYIPKRIFIIIRYLSSSGNSVFQAASDRILAAHNTGLVKSGIYLQQLARITSVNHQIPSIFTSSSGYTS